MPYLGLLRTVRADLELARGIKGRNNGSAAKAAAAAAAAGRARLAEATRWLFAPHAAAARAAVACSEDGGGKLAAILAAGLENEQRAHVTHPPIAHPLALGS